MEPPIEPSQQDKDFRLLLQRLSSLPKETSLPILLTLDIQQLLTICDESSKEEAPLSLFQLSYFCNDPNFWQDFLIEKGFILPEEFPKLITALRGKRSEAETIKTLFFNLEGRKTLLGEYYSRVNFDNQQTKDELLDLGYLVGQISNYNQRKKWPDRQQVFVVSLDVPKEIWQDTMREEELLDKFYNIESISYGEILQDIVDYELTVNPGSLRPHLDLPAQTKLSGDFIAQLREQQLVLIGDLLQKGDIFGIQFMQGDEPQHEIFFFFDDSKLYPIPNDIKWNLFLPQIAVPFLISKKVHTLKDLWHLYLRSADGQIRGIVKLYSDYTPTLRGFESPIDEEQVTLGSTDDTPLIVGKHTFYIKR